MKKIITTLTLVFMSFFMMGQSFINLAYEDFFAKMITDQENSGNTLIKGPEKTYYDDGSYNVLVKFRNNQTNLVMISVYSFNPNCSQIYQFIVLSDSDMRDGVKQSIGEKLTSRGFYRTGDTWYEYRSNGVTISHSLKIKELSGYMGVEFISKLVKQ